MRDAAADCREWTNHPCGPARECIAEHDDYSDGNQASTGIIMSAGAAGAAAAARARRRREEEESMATYTPEEMADGWEFKILRSATRRFADPEFLRRSLEEEAAAGWTLIEKFDNNRIRLKRPATARGRDSSLTCDPYRTTVGMTEQQLTFIVVSSVLGAVGLVLLVVFLATRR